MSRFLIVCVLVLEMAGIAYSQERSMPAGTVVGRVVDAELAAPLEYANAVLYEKGSNNQITGAMTDSNGVFRLFQVKPGTYTLEVSFMGYYPKKVENLVVGDQEAVRAGTVKLERAVILMEGVDVTSEKPAVEFKIDKKVINVSKDFTAISGTAVDVLQNAPSVTVDIEGNVSLRGSTNFTLLIDGRPTVLEPNDALQQIPASNVEQIELITNPSAKYDPSGIAGIINVIMKKQKSQGTNGIVNANIGLDEKYGGDFLVNHRTDKLNLFVGANYNDQTFPGTVALENQTTSGDTSSFILSSGDSRWQRKFYGFRGGLDWYLSSNDIWSLGLRYGGRDMVMSSDRDFDEWTEPGDTHSLYISETSVKRGGNFYSMNMDYGHTFGEKEHKLSGHAMLSRRMGDEESSTELLDMDSTVTSGQRTTEKGPSGRMQFNIDYTLPIWAVNKFETGYQASLRQSTDTNEVYEYDTVSGEYEYRPEFSNVADYEDNIHSLYALYKGEWGNFGYQGGLRSEYQYRLIELIGESEDFTIDRWDFFPSAHVSYQFPKEHEIMASYTRRIERPRGWELQPFETWMDAYNVRTGNPALKSEYIDSYELGYQKQFGQNLLSLEGYYRMTHNKIERVRSVYEANIILHSVENVGTDYSYGAEAMLEWDLFKWLNVNLTGDLYQYRIEGTLYGEQFSRESFNWNTRLNTTLRLSASTRLQINGIYYSPSVSSQGRREGFYTTNAAIRQDLWSRKLSLTLQLRDILGTAKHEFTSEGRDFYSYTEFSRKSPVIILALAYNFNRYRPERRGNDQQEEFEGDEEMF